MNGLLLLFRGVHLLLEGEDVSNATVDGVAEPCLGLVADSNDSVVPLVGRDVQEELRRVAGTEHLVHRREARRALLGVEVRREYAPRHALPPQKLARPAGPKSTATSSAAAASTTTTSSSS
ncbi:hypothetical protein BHE74_00054844 [Ensete ventricosum]|nr:hypothetical protein BHE74_00054844 [Ensete ventricosum]RZS23218.1 hypothetical protein BHM03_00056114 [Ensete ventricosum]